MKHILYLILLVFFFSSSCKKEELDINSTSFTCKIDGLDFTDINPEVSINSSGSLIIDVNDNSTEIRITVANFSQRTEGETISFLYPAVIGSVTKDGVTYWNTLEGDLIFSDLNINENIISGTFNFKSNELVDFQHVIVTEGIFTNLNY